jgi:hypothetical protein
VPCLFGEKGRGNTLQKEPGVHIYTLSQLVHAPAGSWERKIEEIEKGRVRAYAYYQPMREAVMSYCASRGKERDRIVTRMLAEARDRPRTRGQHPERDNLTAFEMFEARCYPKIAKFVRSLLREPQPGVHFEGVTLRGMPHFEVTNMQGETLYVFLQASDWREDQVKSYLELLAVIIERVFGKCASNVWHMNLRTGKVAKHRSSKRVRRRCAEAARHYERVFRARS